MTKIFWGQNFSAFARQRDSEFRKIIYSEDANKLLNMNETAYLEYLLQRFHIENLNFYWDKRTISNDEKILHSTGSPRDSFYDRTEKRYRAHIITVHIPFSGERELLNCIPSSHYHNTLDIDVKSNQISFEIIDRGNIDEVKREMESNIDLIKKQAENLTVDIDDYNARLEVEIKNAFSLRKEELLRQANLVASLGIPLKREGNIPSTFSVPITPKNLVIKPNAPSTPYAPEPSLPLDQYKEILTIIHDTGISMERLPNVYSGRHEEQIRDFLITVLSTHFASVTGETWNKKGKTDILIRHKNSNLFVAECKIWNGMKHYLDTIDQILSYLTWRDSKSAIVLFIHNQELQPVLDQVESKTKEHSAFVKYYGKTSESWFNFEFHLKDDSTRSLQLAVLCFHFPDKTSDNNQ